MSFNSHSSSIDLDQTCYRYALENPGETKIYTDYTIDEGGIKLSDTRPIKIGKVIASGAYNEILETDLNRIVQIPHELIKKAPRYEGNLYKSMDNFTHNDMVDAAYKSNRTVELMSLDDTEKHRSDFLKFLKEKREMRYSNVITDTVNQWKFWSLRTLIENNLKYKFSSWYQDGKVNRAIRDVQPKSYGCILILSSEILDSRGQKIRAVGYKFGITMDKYEGNLLNFFENMKKMNGGSRTTQQKSAIIIQKAVRKILWKSSVNRWATSKKFPSANKIFRDIKSLYTVLADNGMFCSDVKPENIVYKWKGAGLTLKLIDIDAEPNSCIQELCIVDNPNEVKKNVYLELMLLLFFAKILQDVNVDNHTVQPFFNQLFNGVLNFITNGDSSPDEDQIKSHLVKIIRPFLSLYNKNTCFRRFLSTIVPHYHTNIRDDGLTHAGKYQKKAQKIIENWNWDEIIPKFDDEDIDIFKQYYAPLFLCIYCKVNTPTTIIRRRTQSSPQRKQTRKSSHTSKNKSRRRTA